MTIDTHAFRRALGHFATGVAIVTACGSRGSTVGMTITSFNSVSLEPPLVLFSVAKTALSLPDLQMADAYAVSVLRDDQVEVSNRFARQNIDKWAGVDVRFGETRCPLIASSLACFECSPFDSHDGGDHIIFIGRVVNFEATAEASPLLFFRGAYKKLDEIGMVF